MTLSISFNFEVDDWLAFQKHHIAHSKKQQNLKLFTKLFLPVFCTILLILDILKGKSISPTLLTVFIIISTLWYFLYPKRLDKNMERRFRKQIEECDNSNIIGEHNIQFNEEDIISKTLDTENKIKWKGIKKIEETKDYYFLYNTAISAIIIPKRHIEKHLLELDNIFSSKLDHSPLEYSPS